jgi:hypothetical protein
LSLYIYTSSRSYGKVATMFARSGLRSTQRVFAGARNGAINVTKVNLPQQTATRPHETETDIEGFYGDTWDTD